MPEKLIKKIRTSDGDCQIDYNALANLPDLSAVGVQADWEQKDETQKDYIKNKPIIGQVAALNEISKDNLSAELKRELDIVDGANRFSSIDMTALDSDGVIVETFADGSTKTTTIEFDANDNPIKITDTTGKVTVLTW
jgi:YD repeat-containing protein